MLKSLSLGLALTCIFNTVSIISASAQELQKHLDPYPADTAALAVSRLQLTKWQRALKQLPPEAQQMLKELNAQRLAFEAESQLDLISALQPLGTYFSLAYLPRTGQQGDLLFALDLRSQNQTKTFIQKLLSYLKDQGVSIKEQRFAEHTILSIDLEENEQQLSFTLSRNKVLGTVSQDQHTLKNMLYLQAVHPQNSVSKLNNRKGFAEAKNALKSHSFWAYTRSQEAVKALSYVLGLDLEAPEIKSLVASEWTQQLLNYYETLGLGYSIDRGQVDLSLYRGHTPAKLTPYQQEIIEKSQTQMAWRPLFQHMPTQSFVLVAGQWQAGQSPWPSDAASPQAFRQFATAAEQNPDLPRVPGLFHQDSLIADLSGLSPESLHSHFAGPYLFGFANPKAEGALPQFYAVLQLKDSQAHAHALAQKIQINPQHPFLSELFQGINEPLSFQQWSKGQNMPFNVELPSKVVQRLAQQWGVSPELIQAQWQPCFIQQENRLLFASGQAALNEMQRARSPHPSYAKFKATDTPLLWLNTPPAFQWLELLFNFSDFERKEMSPIKTLLQLKASQINSPTNSQLQISAQLNDKQLPWLELFDAPIAFLALMIHPAEEKLEAPGDSASSDAPNEVPDNRKSQNP